MQYDGFRRWTIIAIHAIVIITYGSYFLFPQCSVSLHTSIYKSISNTENYIIYLHLFLMYTKLEASCGWLLLDSIALEKRTRVMSILS